MTLPEPLFYTIEEVAERWGKTEKDLLQLGAQGVVLFAFFYNGKEGPVKILGDIGIEKHLLGGLGDDELGVVDIDAEFLYLDRPINIVELSATGTTKVQYAKLARKYMIGPVGKIDGAEKDGPEATQLDREIFDSYYHVKDGVTFIEAKDPKVEFIRLQPEIFIDKLRILPEELLRIETEYPEFNNNQSDIPADDIAVGDGSTDPPEDLLQSKQGKNSCKGGNPKGPLRKAVEIAYKHMHEQKQTEFLKPYKVTSFISELKKLNLSDLKADGKETGISNYIKKVKDTRPYRVETLESYNGKNKFKKDDISKILHDLRGKFPLG